MGRPSSYSVEIAAELCAEIASRSESLEKICADERFPDRVTVYRWLCKHEEFRNIYARARADQAQLLADEIVEIADTPKSGQIVTEKPDGVEVKTADMIEHRRLQIEARKWVAAKLLPKKYGDKINLDHSGEVAVKRVILGKLG